MSSSPVDGRLACAPLTQDQARLLMRASPSPVMVVNVEQEGFCVLAVDTLLRRFVVGARHPAGPTSGEVIDADGFASLGPTMTAAVARPEEQHSLELPIGDEPLWFEIAVTPVVADGECRQLLLVAADRTGEHEIEKRQRRSARRFKAMVTHAPGLIFLVDSTGRFIQCSPAVDRLLGVKPETLIGRPIFELLHPDSLARAASVFNHLLSQPGESVTIADFRMNHSSGDTLWCEATATNLLHDDDVAAIVFNAYDVTDRRMAEERLELSATSDSLTGLANRRRLEYRVAEAFDGAARINASVGLVLVDLDDFKLVNDGLGHDIGDGVLRVVADRLEGLVADLGLVARIGGDEFALMLERIDSEEDLSRLAEGIHESLRSPIAVGEHDVYVRGSVGTTTGHPDSSDAASLLRSADLALYRAKRNGRNQTVSFTAELQLEAEERLATITDLQRAIREGRLRLAYQPVVDEEGALVGAEALLRWTNGGELLSPAAFLKLAEDTGLILPIGAWVLGQTCQDLKALQAAVPGLRWVSVNLSSRQLMDEQLPLLIQRALDEHDVDATSLAVEIDEATIDEQGRVVSVLQRLGNVAVMLALTDVAASQDVLARLPGMPIGNIKLDQAFVQQLDVDTEGRCLPLVTAVFEHAAATGLNVIAEGVEHESQARILRDAGCKLFQGFLYSEPLDLGSFITAAHPPPRT